LILLLAAMATSCVLNLVACQTQRQPKHNFVLVPTEEVLTAKLSSEQYRVISTRGDPDVVWKKPFEVYLWVYCRDDDSVDLFEFDMQGMLMSLRKMEVKDLCEKPVDFRKHQP
jgi:hypothetical protein